MFSSTSSTSSAITAITALSSEDDVAVGLSDVQYSLGRRKMLDLVNKLHSTGVQLDIDLPMIAVIGSQSAGKSSLIESISGITLPRASGTCTRCPTECRLTNSASPWQCIVSLRFVTDRDGKPVGQVKDLPFGETITDKREVEARIRRAQRAILNPSTDPSYFLNGPDEDPENRELTFSKSCVCLQISGSGLTDLSFCDLPGLIASVGNGGHHGDIELVQSLVTAYIEKPSCIILLTVACETDFENQGAHHLAKLHDPEGKRTIGVLTKPDRIPAGEEENWIRFIRNDREPLDNGWYGVKQPDSRALQRGISWSEARTEERDYFSYTAPWTTLDPSHQQHLGTSYLTEKLSAVLSGLIAKRLPELQDELQKLIHKTEDGLKQLPSPPSTDCLREVLDLLATFSRELAKRLEGTPDEEGLLQAIRPKQEAFRRAIRATAPNFRPYEKTREGDLQLRQFAPPGFLSHEEGPMEDSGHVQGRDAIYIDEVMGRAEKAITRELPDHYPFIVCNELIMEFTKKWLIPARNLFDSVYQILLDHVKRLINQHFSKYAQGGLQHQVMVVVMDFLKGCSEATMQHIRWLLELEKRPRTLNLHYYSDYRDKFFAHYKGYRRTDADGNAVIGKLEGLQLQSDGSSAGLVDFETSTAKVLSGLNEIGIHGVKPADLPKLLPSDPLEPALTIMAAVRGYFQVAYKRFADNVPMAIDHELVLGLDRERALENALLNGLGLTGANGYQRCKELLQEPPNIIARREELQNKRERLDAAKRELLALWL